jgi:hypothetical protein
LTTSSEAPARKLWSFFRPLGISSMIGFGLAMVGGIAEAASLARLFFGRLDHLDSIE